MVEACANDCNNINVNIAMKVEELLNEMKELHKTTNDKFISPNIIACDAIMEACWNCSYNNNNNDDDEYEYDT